MRSPIGCLGCRGMCTGLTAGEILATWQAKGSFRNAPSPAIVHVIIFLI